jgi:hypothetical protein
MVLIKYPSFILSKLASNLTHFFNYIIKSINTIIFKLDKVENLDIKNISYDNKLKCHVFEFSNSKLLDHTNLMKAIFNTLKSTKEFNNDSNKKIILTSIVKSGKEFFIPKNIAVDSNTSILDYINKIESSIKNFYESGYEVHSFNDIKVLNVGSCRLCFARL